MFEKRQRRNLEGIKISNSSCHSTRLLHLLNFSHLFELAGTQSLQLRKVELHTVKPISKSLLYQNTRNVGRCGLVTRYRVSQLRRKSVTCDSCSQLYALSGLESAGAPTNRLTHFWVPACNSGLHMKEGIKPPSFIDAMIAHPSF